MGAVSTTITATTKTELKKLVTSWRQQAREQGFAMTHDYDPARVQRTEEGYSIFIRAHT